MKIHKPIFEDANSREKAFKEFLNSPDKIAIWENGYSDGIERTVMSLGGVIRNSMQLDHVLTDKGTFTVFVFLRKDDKKILDQLVRLNKKFIIVPNNPKDLMFKDFKRIEA